MTTGSADFGVTSGQTNETQSVDILELASRLNAIAAINRTGQQIITISEAILYNQQFFYSSTGNGYCMPSNLISNFNRPSLKCITGSANGEQAGVQFNHLPFGSKQIGEAGYFIAGSFACTLMMGFQLVINQVLYQAGVEINLNTGAVGLWNNSGAYTMITTAKVPNSMGEPFVVKFTVDFNTQKYGDLYYGSEDRADISAYQPQITTASVPDLSQIQALIQNQTAASNNIYINDVIITINEAM